MDVTIRPWTGNDAAALARVSAATDRQFLTDRLPEPYSERDAAWYLNLVASRDGRDALFRAVCVDGEVVGTISVEQQSDVFRRDAEIGYFLAPDACGKGVMTRAVRLMCEEAFELLRIERITANVRAENIASRRLLERNGFALEGVMRRAVVKYGEMHDLCIYGKLRGESTCG